MTSGFGYEIQTGCSATHLPLFVIEGEVNGNVALPSRGDAHVSVLYAPVGVPQTPCL